MSYPELLTAEQKLADAKERLGLPPIMCICGSTRFWSEMAESAWGLTVAGWIVLRPDVDAKQPGTGISAEGKARLDELHRAKIRLADEVLVVNPGGYIGDSTRGEIAYAEQLGLPVRYTHPPADGRAS